MAEEKKPVPGTEGDEKEPFNPNEHLMQISGKDYLPVQWRLVWFREMFPHGTIDTEEVVVDLDREVEEEVFVYNKDTRRSEKVLKKARGYARFRAVVTDGHGGKATGTKSENAASFAEFAEKAETGAIGRALAGLGFGTQFTGDEFDEKHRIVDAPVDHTDPSPKEVRQPVAAVKPAAQVGATQIKPVAAPTPTSTPVKAPESPKEDIPSLAEEGTPKSVMDEDMLTISMKDVNLIEEIITQIGEPDISHELTEGFFPFCNLPKTQDLYDPVFWQQAGRHDAMKGYLTAWMKPALQSGGKVVSTHRDRWRDGKITPTQFARFKDEIVPLLDDNDVKAKAEIKRIRDLDSYAHGKPIGEISAATADRLIKAILDSDPDEQGVRQVEIPEEYRYKAPKAA